MEINSKDIEHILAKYPSLEFDNESKILKGIINIDKYINDEHIIETFDIEVDFKKNLPQVVEKSEKIKDYSHQYKSQRLCLETDWTQKVYLLDHSIEEWFEYFVVNYLGGYVYYTRYGCHPFGERPHGILGEIEALSEYFKVKAEDAVIILAYIAKKKYRGHDICPCGSGKKVRTCHKDQIMLAKSEENIDTFNALWENIEREVKYYESKKRKKHL